METFRVIAFQCGYVEEAKLSWLFFVATGKPPTSRKEAIDSLVEMFFQRWRPKLNAKHTRKHARFGRCCIEHFTKHSLDECPECERKRVETLADVFDLDEWQQRISNLHDSTTDSYGSAEDEGPYGWSPWEDWASHDDAIIFVDNADAVFGTILAQKHPELGLEVQDWLEAEVQAVYEGTTE